MMRFKGWFGPKVSGIGVGPRSWQGWLATALVLAVVIGSRFVPPQALGLPAGARPAIIGITVLAYLVLTFVTYDPDA